MPQVEGTAGRFMLKQMAVVAEIEAGFVSDRTKAALAAAKRRGKKLGLSSEPKCNTADLIIGTVDQDLRECCHAMLFAFVG